MFAVSVCEVSNVLLSSSASDIFDHQPAARIGPPSTRLGLPRFVIVRRHGTDCSARMARANPLSCARWQLCRSRTAGRATLGDIDVLKQKDAIRHRLGYLPQEFGVYPRISAQDMLSRIALLKGVTNAMQRKDVVGWMLKRCNLYDDRKKALTGFCGEASHSSNMSSRKPESLLDAPQ